jgi:hypothetical protein
MRAHFGGDAETQIAERAVLVVGVVEEAWIFGGNRRRELAAHDDAASTERDGF